MDFKAFCKIPRLSRECIVTEKIDGSNGLVFVGEDGEFRLGSRSRWIVPESDNFGFAAWGMAHKEELMLLGPGFHYGEWWGRGIQRGYNQIDRKFSLFNVAKWSDDSTRPKCCGVVPVIATCLFDTIAIDTALTTLKANKSYAAPGYPFPEGIVIYHKASGQLFKKTIENDEQPKNSKETK